MSDTIELTANRVVEIFKDCLFTDDEDTSTAVKAEGVMNTAGFHPERLEGHKEEIMGMLKQLPDNFQEEGGGGWSFLNACDTKDDVQWGEHPTMDQLLILGIATEQATILLPRDMWHVFPKEMPYFMVKKREEENEKTTD